MSGEHDERREIARKQASIRWETTVLPSGGSTSRQVTIAGSPALKNRRANLHFKALDTAVDDYMERDSHQLIFDKVEGKPLERLARLGVLEPPPMELSIIMGDSLHNHRSALDHMAGLLAEVYSGVALELTEFPIFKDPTKYHHRDNKGRPARGSGLFKVQGMSPQAQTMIEGFQPFNGSGPPDRHPLWLLHELSNADKHRILNLTYFTADKPEFGSPDATNVEIESVEYPPGPYKHGDAVAHIRLRLQDPSKPGRIELVTPLRTVLAFQDGAAQGLPMLATLAEIGMYVATVLHDLTTLLPSG